jgi:restriction system protein
VGNSPLLQMWDIVTIVSYNVEKTPVTGDFGADLLLKRRDEKVAIQAKCYSGSVGVDAVQQALAGKEFYRCRHAMVVTNSKFTKNAVEFAKKYEGGTLGP